MTGSLCCSCPFLEHGSCPECGIAPGCSLLWEKCPRQSLFSGTSCCQPQWDSLCTSVQPRQPCSRVRSKVLPLQCSCSCSPSAGRSSCVQRLLTAGFVVWGGLPQFYRVELLWDLIPGTRRGAFLGIRTGRPSTFWCPVCVAGAPGGAFLQLVAMSYSEGVQRRGSVCYAALITASLLQGSSGLCPPRATSAEDAERPGEHTAGARHAHHHKVGPCLLRDFILIEGLVCRITLQNLV